ncbi:hypothetical protein QM590_08530 [Rhodococcus sp. IEGM 1372]|nr:hypothetical protein [Rhodococcus sp. IEGM 1372]
MTTDKVDSGKNRVQLTAVSAVSCTGFRPSAAMNVGECSASGSR